MDVRDSLLCLSRKTLEGLALTTDEVIESIEHAIRGRSRAQAWNAPKAVIQPPAGRYMVATLSAADDPPFLAEGKFLSREAYCLVYPKGKRHDPKVDVFRGWLLREAENARRRALPGPPPGIDPEQHEGAPVDDRSWALRNRGEVRGRWGKLKR
jgi:hypothetical protein